MAASADSLSFSTLIHMITINLSSTNYLLWRNQVSTILDCQDLLSHVDGSISTPSRTILDEKNTVVENPKFISWRVLDRRLLSLLLSSLTEEAMSEVLGCSSSCEVWIALESAYSHDSKSRELLLKDDLQLIKNGSRTVSEYGRQFKALCDQLAAIGRPVDDTDKAHWFLRGLGLSFSSFSAAQMAITPLPSFRDLLSKAESFSIFQESLDAPAVSAAAFTAHQHTHVPAANSTRGRGHSSNRGRGRSGYRRPPRCQICREDGHYASACKDRYVRPPASSSENLSQAFNASCNISPSSASDWYLDTGASAHMTPEASHLESYEQYNASPHKGDPSKRPA